LKKLFTTEENKRLTLEDKIIPTPIDFNRVVIVLSSTVDYCSFRTVRILTSSVFILESEMGLNLLLFVAMLGHWRAGLVAVATVRR
jgi:hypothetical protein